MSQNNFAFYAHIGKWWITLVMLLYPIKTHVLRVVNPLNSNFPRKMLQQSTPRENIYMNSAILDYLIPFNFQILIVVKYVWGPVFSPFQWFFRAGSPPLLFYRFSTRFSL